MDAKPSQLAPEPLNYQTWFLKVSIHCEGCRRKVKKVLKRIDGVFTATIDAQQQKVTVTGSVGVETLLKKLARAGKHAEIWPENVADKGQKKKSLENKGSDNATAGRCKREKKSSSSSKKSPEKSPSGDREGGGGGGGGSEKKKKKGSSGANTGLQCQDLVGPGNCSPTRQQLISYPETGFLPMVYVATCNRFYPSYYVPCVPYTCAALDHPGFHFQSPPLPSFDIFSDENANACSVM